MIVIPLPLFEMHSRKTSYSLETLTSAFCTGNLNFFGITSVMAMINGLCSSMSAFSSGILFIKVSAFVYRHFIDDAAFFVFIVGAVFLESF